MKQRQTHAYKYPVTSQAQILHGRYNETLFVDRYALGSILTLSVLDNEPRWHASISFLKADWKPLRVDKVPRAARKVIERLLMEMLDGVGNPDDQEMFPYESAFHLSRALTLSERAGLNQLSSKE